MAPLQNAPAPPQDKPQRETIWRGLSLAIAVAAGAFLLGRIPALHFVSPMILAVFLGIIIHSRVQLPKSFDKGLTFCLRFLLKFAVVLLGLQLSFSQLFAVGLDGLLAIALTLISTFFFCLWLGKRLGLDPKLTRLIAAGTSICGASAIVATNSVIKGKDEHVAYAITVITLFGFLSMLLFPLIGRYLELDPATFGLWSGASIHETAQVIGAAFQGGQTSGEVGTVAKLSRVLFLVPVVVILGYYPSNPNQQTSSAPRRLPIPWFILAFIAVVAINSLFPLEAVIKEQVKVSNKFHLTIALAAMGLQMNFSKVREIGLRPLCLGALSWLYVSTVGLILARLLT